MYDGLQYIMLAFNISMYECINKLENIHRIAAYKPKNNICKL